MENLYQLMNERIKRCETDERDYSSLFREYFFCEIVPNLMDRTINNIDLTNYRAYQNYESLPIREKIEILRSDDGILKYDGMVLRINNKLLNYFNMVIEKFFKENNLGKFHSLFGYDKYYFIIDTTLGNLINAYNEYMNGDVSFEYDYENRIKLASSILSDIYENDVLSKIYMKFLNNLALLIKREINKISIFNYQDFDAKKSQIDEHFYVCLDDKKDRKYTNLDIVTNNNYLIAVKDLINRFVKDYEIGSMVYDGAYRVDLNTNLADLMSSYYMEIQRMDYLIRENKPKSLANSKVVSR